MIRTVGAFSTAVFLSSCTLLPIEQNGAATIDFFKRSIECEIAAVASIPKYDQHFGLRSWNVKSALDLALVTNIGADGKAAVVIPSAILPSASPSLSVASKKTQVGHLDFATSIPDAVRIYGSTCVFDPGNSDPSGTHLGLAAWIIATLDQIEPKNHGGLTYTVEFDLTVSAESRFGFVFHLTNLDAGIGASREGTHRLTVSMSQPSGKPEPLAVRVVGPVKVVGGGPKLESIQPESDTGVETKKPIKRGASVVGRRQSPALDDPNLNRLLLQQAPVRIAPGSAIR